MRRQQTSLTDDPFDVATLKTGLLRYLIGHDVQSIDIALDEVRMSVSVTLKKSIAPVSILTDIIRDTNKYISARYGATVSHIVDGIVADGNTLQVICTFEVD